MTRLTRRGFLALATGTTMGGVWKRDTDQVRTFDVCLNPDALEADPSLLPAVHTAGVSAVWLPGFFYGHWPYPLNVTRMYAEQLRKLGMEAYIIDLALGHPGDSLGAMKGNIPLTPPKHWRLGVRVNGTTYAGTSLHDPAVEENCAALRAIAKEGYRRVFLDDDFRLAQGPGMVGGCFCAQHKELFLQSHGYSANQWPELLEDVNARRYTPLLRSWCDWNCHLLTSAFRAQQKAAGNMKLGIMVMWMGAEKAGIRLRDYSGALFRVGEGHFDDASLASEKGWTDELFSALFHRRFARAELSYSETTAFPAHALSVANMAAKLTVSTIADVRTTCFMSGLSPFPKIYWHDLAPRMHKEARMHSIIAGHGMKGPVKLWWGLPGRYVSDDNPYSLAMALGIPFEMCRAQPTNGWIFLGDYDAMEPPQTPIGANAAVICRPGVRSRWPNTQFVAERLADLAALRQRIVAAHPNMPHVVENAPVVLAWYPSAKAAILWNLSRDAQSVTLKAGSITRSVALEPLGAELLQGLPELAHLGF